MADAIWIIDGDNVTHARGGGGEYALLRERLAADVTDWAARLGVRAVVVLDGEGNDRTVGATVISHSRGETADSVIERLAYRHAADSEVTVVSNDTVVRHVSQRGGVHAMSAREFLDRLAAAPEPPSWECPITPALPAFRCYGSRYQRGFGADSSRPVAASGGSVS